MIEPAIEDRFSSAKQSLNALQNPILPSLESRIRSLEISHSLGLNSDHNDTKYQYPKPLGSRIEIKKSNNILKVDIPAAGLRGEGISLLLFAIFWNVFLIVWTSFALRVGAFALFSIPFWVVGIGIAYAGLSIVFGKVYLVISDRTFSIDWDILGVKRHVQGKTQDLRQLELKSSYEVNNQPVMELRLNQGIYVHKFGSGLSRPEKEWLLQEINNFLEAWRSCH
jgi:hypothetical protein